MTLLTILLIYALLLTLALGRAGFRNPAEPAAGGTPPRPERLLVVGASGGTGRQLVAQALARGYAVTAFVRDPSKLGIRHPQLRVVQGDVLDATSVDAAVPGHDALLVALGHKSYYSPRRILSEGTGNLLRAMERAGVRRLVCETSLGIGDSAGRLGLSYTFFVIPLILPLYYWDKTRQERAIAASGVDWVIVRPGVLTDGPRSDRIAHGRRIGGFLLSVRVSRADTAAFMLDQLESDSYLRRAPGLRG